MATKKSSRSSRRAPAQRKSETNYGGLAIALAMCLIALLALVGGLFGGFALATVPNEVTQVAPTPTKQAPATVPTVQAVPPTAQADAPAAMSFVPYEPEGGIPFNGSTWNVDVAPDEIEVFTGGPLTINGVSLPGGENRGSVLILLPGTKVTAYTVTGVLPGANWHASYRPLSADESTWRALANDRVAAMQQAPNCTPGTGCITLDVLVVGPNGVVDQWVVTK